MAQRVEGDNLPHAVQDTLQDLSKLRHKFPHFVNRKTDELSHIVKCLDPENKQCQVVFIDGAPGIGKTTLATEAANKLHNKNRNVSFAYIDCKDIKSFESFAVIEQIYRWRSVEDPDAEMKKLGSKDYFLVLVLDNFECFLEENNDQQEERPSKAAAQSLDCREKVQSLIREIANCPTNIKFLVTSSQKVPFFSMLVMKEICLNPFDKEESSKLLEKVRCGKKISDETSEELWKICSGIPLVLHTLISSLEDLIGLLEQIGKSPSEETTNFLSKMKTVSSREKKIEICLDLCFRRLTPQVQLTLLRLCVYRGFFTPDKAAKIFCSPKSSVHDLRDNVLELGRCNLLHPQKFQDTMKYTVLTVIREHFKFKGEKEYRGEIEHARGMLIDYLISFLKETFKVFLGKNSVKLAIEEFSAEKENLMQLVEWIDNDEMDEERVKKCIDVFNVAGEMLAKMMAKFNYRYVYDSLAKKCREMGDKRRLAECLTSLGIKEIFNCICATGLCDKAIKRARLRLDEADEIQTHLQVNKGNSRAQCLAKLGRCLVRSDDTERGMAMIEEAIRIRKAAVETPDHHEEEGGDNVCYVMLGATYNDKAVALSFENHHREAVNIRKNQVMAIYRERLGDHPFTATILNNLSNNHRDLREFKAAEEYAEHALRIRRELLADHRDTIKSLFDLGMALKANKRFREAKDLLEQCKTMQEKLVNDSTFEKNCCEMMAQKDESEPIPIPPRDAGHHAPQMLGNYGGITDDYGVYGFMRDLILEGKVAKWVNNSGGYVLDWPRAVDRYADYEAKKNPLFKRTNQRRGKASKRLRKALLNVHKKDGATEYMESKKVNEKGQVVERQFQMPPKVFQSLFRNAELSDSGEEQDEQKRMRHLSQGAVEAQVSPESSSDAGFEETVDLSCGILIQGLPVPHSGNDLMRSMEDSQQKIATIVYRAGTKDGPSFDSDENINEAWLVTNPKLYFPLDQDQLPESCMEHLEGIFLWEADVSTLGEGLTSPYDGVIKVEQNDSNYKCTPKEIKELLKSLKWRQTTVPKCSGGLSLMDLSPLVQAVIVYMKDHYPTNPEELNFYAELKAKLLWYWLKENGNTSALKKVPADDCRLKIAVSKTLKTWEKEREDLEAKEQRTDDSDEELSDAREAIEVLKNYLANGENKKGILIQGLPVPQHSGNDLMTSMEDSQKIATIVYRAGTEDGPSFDSNENINEAWLVTNPKLYFPLGQDLSESCKKRLEGIVLWEGDVSTLGDGLTYPYDGVIKVELNDSRNSKCASKEIKELLKSLKWRQTTVPKCSGGLSLMDLSPLVQAVVVYMKDHYPTNPEELNFHAELKAASQWYWLKGNGNTSALKKVPADDCRLKIAVRETLKTWEKEKEDLEAKEQRTDDSDEELSDATEAIEVLKNYLGESKKDTLQRLSKLRPTFPHFVYRKTDELSRIVEWLDPKNKQYQGVFIYGAPGIGKTTLATEAANKLRNDNRHVLVAYIDCIEIKSFESFAATVIKQICRSPAVEDPAAEIKKRLVASKGYFYILFLDNFECFIEENNNPQEDQPSTAAAPCLERERVLKFIGEIVRRPTNIKFLVTSSEIVSFPRLAMETIHLNPFDEDESSKLLKKVRYADRISVEECKELCKSCSGIPLVLHTLISLQEDLKCFVKSSPEERTNFLWKMKTVPKEDKIEFCLNHCFQRLTPQAQLTLLSLCLYKGLFTPEKAAKIFCSPPESSEHNLRAIVLELGRRNLLHLLKFQDTNKYTFLTVIREHFKRKAKQQEYGEKIQHVRGLLIDYLISFLKETFKVFLGKNSVKSAIEEFSAEKENVMQLVEWIDKGEMDEERVKKCIDVFNVAGEMLAKMMAKFNYKNVYESLAKKSEEMGDQQRLAECLTSLGIQEIFNCICATGLNDEAIERARPSLEKADRIQTHLQVNRGNSRAQCLAKLGRCLVRSSDIERGQAMIDEAIRIRQVAVQTPDDHEEEGGENVCHVMLGATYNDKAVALSFENHYQEAVNIRRNQVMPIYRERLGEHPFTATILNNLSNNHRDLGEFGAAEECAKQALDIRRELLADHRDTTKSLFDLGVALKANGNFREAKDLLEQCKTMQEKVVNDSTFEENLEEELRHVNRLLDMQQSEGQDQ